MKHIKILQLIICFFFSFSHSQNESSIWYFGRWGGLDFNTNPPTVLFNGYFTSIEGCASMSDENGNLLFYTEGTLVRDRNHDIVPNGIGIDGHISSSQSAVIVPKPGDSNIYYIFTTDAMGSLDPFDGLRYSEFDLALNSGNGAITNNKNILLSASSTEKISVIKQANGVDYWVVAHEWESNNFLVYSVTSNGININPSIQSIGSIHNGNNDAIGYMKISPNGRWLALAEFGNDSFGDSFVQLFNFDDGTGQISNPITISGIFQAGIYAGAYGIEFSPNSNLLYVSDTSENISGASRVYQFNLSLATPTEIINSAYLLYDGEDSVAALQLAIDGKIYLANNGVRFLDVILNPDNIGNDANYMNRHIDIGIAVSKAGLPSFIQSYFHTEIINFDGNCEEIETLFSIDSEEDVLSVLWNFGDGFTSDLLNPSHLYSNSGTYDVTANISFMNQVTRTATREIIIYDTPVANSVSNYELCDDISNDQIETFDLSSKINEVLGTQSNMIFNVAFYESLVDAENDQNRLALQYNNNFNSQEVFVRTYNVDYEDCYVISSFLLNVNPFPIANNIEDVYFCDEQDNDGSIFLDLTQFNTTVLQNQSSNDFVISYHLTQNEADNNINPLSNDFQTVNNPQNLFVRIESLDNAECSDTTEFNVFINQALSINQVEDLYECENSINSEIALFDLTLQSQQITNNLVGTFNISYFQSEQDAFMNLNMLNTQYTNTTNPELLYARIQDVTNQSCYDIVEFNIHTLAVPNIIENETLYLCTGESIILSADIGFDYYLWSTGETSQSISVDMSGTYTVEIGNSYNINSVQNCTTTKTFNVIESGTATNIEIEIGDWTANQNTILVIVDGLGDYEYSLNGIDYSELNLFENLVPGEYAVYIKDKNNCGVVTEFVFLLNYPRFFTPNNDGINDNWQVIFSREEPSLKISIYDRYGKKLTSISPLSNGWDGNYNGRPLPSGDYWFEVERPSTGRTYKGHFSLKR